MRMWNSPLRKKRVRRNERTISHLIWHAAGALVVDQQNVLLLQRRVEALQNSERNLKQRLNQTTALLDEERRRNSSLKGA